MPSQDETHRREDRAEELLEAIVAAADPASALAAACAAHPACAPRLRKAFAALHEFSLLTAPRRDVPAAIGGHEIVEVLGRGGMGVVYRAWDPDLGREVALKVLRPELLHFEQSRQRFRREVEVVSRLRHPGIVAVHSAGEDGSVPFFTMELVDGASLADTIAALRGQPLGARCGSDLLPRRATAAGSTSSGPRLPDSWIDACVQIGRMVAEALQHAHDHGVYHRDVKPSNVLVDEHGRARLLDFGLARLESGQELTKSTSMLGSLPYMPPEQVTGRTHEHGARQDVYALGVTLYELLTLRSPFLRATHEATRRSIAAGDAVPPRRIERGLGRELETVCLKAMDLDPDRRYASARDLATDLENLLQRRPVLARPASPVLRSWRFAQRHPTASVAAVLGVLLVIASLLVAGTARRAAAAERDARAQLVDSTVRFVSEFAQGLRRIPGSTEVRAELLQRAVGQLAALEREIEDDAERLAVIGGAHLVLADVLGNPDRTNLGEREPARARYRHVADLADRIDARLPERAAWLRARALRGLAEIARFDGDIDGAIALQREAADVLRPHLAASAAENAPDALETLYLDAESKLASLAGSQGRHEVALRGFEAVLVRHRERARAHPDDEDAQLAVAKAAGAVSIARYQLGDHARAADEMGVCVRALEERLARAPSDAVLLRERLSRGMLLAEMLIKAGRLEEAVALCARDGQRCRALGELDPADARLRQIDLLLRYNRGWAHLARAERALADGAPRDGAVLDDLRTARRLLREARAAMDALRAAGELQAGMRQDRLDERLANVDALLGEG